MTLLLFSTTPSLSSLSPQLPSRPASTPAITPTHFLRVQNRVVKTNLFTGLQSHAPFLFNRSGTMIVKASSEIDSMGSDNATPPPLAKEEMVPIENLPLESKLQLIQEQKLKMNLAKKIRLRRKRLVRKRHLSKKGRWPLSKMKKNKNV